MIKLKNKLRRVMIEKNVTQVLLSEMTGIKQGKISEIVTMKRGMINIDHMERIANALNIKEINRLFEFKIESVDVKSSEKEEIMTFKQGGWMEQISEVSTEDHFEKYVG